MWNPSFVQWENIKSIEKPNEKDDSIWLVLDHKEFWTKRIRLYCLPGTAPTIVDFITHKVSLENIN